MRRTCRCTPRAAIGPREMDVEAQRVLGQRVAGGVDGHDARGLDRLSAARPRKVCTRWTSPTASAGRVGEARHERKARPEMQPVVVDGALAQDGGHVGPGDAVAGVDGQRGRETGRARAVRERGQRGGRRPDHADPLRTAVVRRLDPDGGRTAGLGQRGAPGGRRGSEAAHRQRHQVQPAAGQAAQHASRARRRGCPSAGRRCPSAARSGRRPRRSRRACRWLPRRPRRPSGPRSGTAGCCWR